VVRDQKEFDNDDSSFNDSSIANSQNSIENLKFKKRLKRTFIDKKFYNDFRKTRKGKKISLSSEISYGKNEMLECLKEYNKQESLPKQELVSNNQNFKTVIAQKEF
jgi:hypothetical protein